MNNQLYRRNSSKMCTLASNHIYLYIYLYFLLLQFLTMLYKLKLNMYGIVVGALDMSDVTCKMC